MTAKPRTIVNASTGKKPYPCPELRPFEGRPGAMDAYKLPSIRGTKRIWPDGRVEDAAK